MRIRTFTAPTMTAAMQKVRDALGEDAIILGTREERGTGVHITAALEQDPATGGDEAALEDFIAAPPMRQDEPDTGEEGEEDWITPEIDLLVQSLAYHGLPLDLSERLCRSAAYHDRGDVSLALAAAIDEMFSFTRIRFGRRILLAGPHGAGKTVTCAKLAAKAALQDNPVSVFTMDTERAGGYEQLSELVGLMQQDVVPITAEKDIRTAFIAPSGAEIQSALIDTTGINPFDEEALNAIRRLAEAASADIVTVLPAGGDIAEMADIACAFRAIGSRNVIFTRLDASRRFGGMLAAAHAARLAIAEVGISPYIAEGLHGLNPVSMTRLLLCDPSANDFAENQDRATA